MVQKYVRGGFSSTRVKKKNKKNKTCKKKISKALKEKATLKCKEILTLLKNQFLFIGCFAQDTVQKLIIQQLPVLLFVNIDSNSARGSHWIALGIFNETLEIFDPLGFKINKWKSIPCELLTFLHELSENRKMKVIRQIQPDNSTLCTFYCLIYVVLRHKFSFEKIKSLFSKNIEKNDQKLETIIKKFF